MSNTTKQITEAIKGAQKSKTSAYDTQAEVRRVEGNTAWVHIPGGVDETPVKMTIAAKKGDTVQVRVSDGTAFLIGNASAPPTDDATANTAIYVATNAQTEADTAHKAAVDAVTSAEQAKASAASAASSASAALSAAQSAQTSADSALVSLSTVEDVVGVLNWITAHGTMTLTSDVTINPAHVYFVVDPTGDYVVGGTHYSIVAEPKVEDISTYYELSVDESVQNYVATHVVVDTEGLWLIPDSGGNKVLIATGAGSSYTTAGTYIIGKVSGVDTVFAKFTTSGATMNATNSVQIAHLGYGEGNNGGSLYNQPYYTLGKRNTTSTAYSASSTYNVGDLCVYNGKVYCCNTKITTAEAWNSSHWQLAIGNYTLVEGPGAVASGAYSHAEGVDTVAIGLASHAEGNSTTASGQDAHAEGSQTTATNRMAHAEGFGSDATGNYGSHAEGYSTTASGNYGSHAEGYSTTASGNYGSHAEGDNTTASGQYAHAEGDHATASGLASHAQNTYTTASGDHQTALGKFNVSDATSAVIIGNGTANNARSNALTIDWNGNVNIASGAKYKINGSNLSASDVGALPISGGTMTSNGQIINGHITNSSSRETTPNLTPTGKRGITALLASGTMTTARPGEGTIIHCEWDTNAGWNAQLFIADNDTGNGKPFVAVRGQKSGTWTAWDRLLAQSDVTDYVIAQSQSTTSYGNGYWRWREWNSGKVEIWYHGSLTLTTSESDSNGVKRYSRWFNFPNSYSLYRCTCIVNCMDQGAWYGCGGVRDASGTVNAEPTRAFQVMGYRIQAQPPTTPSNLNIYICGQKTI